MKLIEFNNSPAHPHGTIAMLKLTKASRNKLYQWCKKKKIPCIDPEELHCTVLYSKNPVPYLEEFNKKKIKISAKVAKWAKLGTALTLKIENNKIDNLHNLMINAGGTHEYPEFIPHVTISYNWDISKLPKNLYKKRLNFNLILIKQIDPDYVGKTKDND